jgi:hypothetical protein
MKRTILITTVIPVFILPTFAQSDFRVKLQAHERVVTVKLPDGHLRAFKLTRPEFKGATLAKLYQRIHSLGPDSSCSYAFFGETCEYDEPSGFILCTAVYWSEACQLGAICYNWFGDCGIGCSLGGECIEGIGGWLLD